VNNKN